jgi:hypothetical protein
MKKKVCKTCGEAKPDTEFYRHPATADGMLVPARCVFVSSAIGIRKHKSTTVDGQKRHNDERLGHS